MSPGWTGALFDLPLVPGGIFPSINRSQIDVLRQYSRLKFCLFQHHGSNSHGPFPLF